jgi:hypothetical protein
MRNNTQLEKLNKVIGSIEMYAEMLAWTNCYIEERIGSRNELPTRNELLEGMIGNWLQLLTEVERSLREEDTE